MKAAIYTRKSTDDNDKNADNKSVTRQRERAKAYAVAKGWTVEPEHIFEDDNVSGAEYQRRPGLVRMMARLKEFNVIVTSENSRIGRDMVRNSVVIDDIRSADVRLFYYLNDSEERFDTPEQRLMATMGGFASEMERAKISERTRDALSRKAEKGYSAGGRCYGYDNHPIWTTAANGEKTRSHTEYRINDEQAEVVRGIFRAYADGHGLAAIAKALNGEAKYQRVLARYFNGRMPPSPQHGKQGTGSWSPSSVRAMLYRIRYVGKLQYGEYRNVRSAGRVGKCVKQEKFSIVERSELAIVPPDLWDRVQSRLKAVRATYVRENGGRLWGRPETGRESKYLLSGMARCGCGNKGRDGVEHVCGANIVVTGGQKHSHYYYGCGYFQNRGAVVCANDHRARMRDLDELVLAEIERKALTPAAVEFVIEEAVKIFEATIRKKPDELPRIENEIKKLHRELKNYNRLIADGRAPKSVLAEIEARERQIETLTAQAERYQLPAQVGELDLRRAHKQAREEIGRFAALMRADVPVARQALRKLLRDSDGNFSPLWFVPVGPRGAWTSYEVRGSIAAVPLFNKAGTEERT